MYKLPDNLSCQTTEDFRKLGNFRKLSEIIEIMTNAPQAT